MTEILVAGAGSIGTVLGVLLTKHCNSIAEDRADTCHVSLLRRRPPFDRVEMSLTGVEEMSQIVQIISLDTELPVNRDSSGTYHAEVVFITTQLQQVENICDQLSQTNWISPDTIIVGLQNGLTGPDTIIRYFPDNPVIVGAVWWSASLLDPKLVLYHRKAPTVLGIPESSSATEKDLDGIISMLSQVLEVEPTDDLEKELQQKLILNVVSPPLALVKQPYPQGLRDNSVRKVVHALFDEALETAYLLDWKVDPEDSKLFNFHKLLVTGNIPKDPVSHDYTHKVSTQLGMEKYGGSGSNVHALLGWLQLSGSLLADEVIQLVSRQPPEYGALDSDIFDMILSNTSSARCNLNADEYAKH